MIEITKEPLPQGKAEKIRQWLNEEGAGYFREAVRYEIAALEVEALQLFRKGEDEDDDGKRDQAHEKLTRIRYLSSMLELMNRFQYEPEKSIHTKVHLTDYATA